MSQATGTAADEVARTLERIRARESAAARRTVLLTLVPVLAGIALVVFSTMWVGQKTDEAHAAEAAAKMATDREAEALASLATTEQQIATLNAQLEPMREELKSITVALDAARKEREDARTERDHAWTERDEARALEAEGRSQLNRLQRELGSTQEDLRKSGEELQRVKGEVETLTVDRDSLQGQLRAATKELEEKKGEVGRLTTEIERTRNLVREAEENLRSVTDLSRQRFELDLGDLKAMAGVPEFELLQRIVDYQRNKWPFTLDKQSPETGFHSPGFAAYVLIEDGRLRDKVALRGESIAEVAARLPERLQKTDNPRPGDLIFYKGGYAMFLFHDRERREFVIGQTIFGIVPMKPDFTDRIAAYRVFGRGR